MTGYVALLRAVNVAGTGKLAMADLRAMCAGLGWRNVRTFIASGNVLFECELPEAAVKAALETALLVHAGKHVAVFVRSAQEMADIVAANPFPDANGSRHMVDFYDAPPPPDLLDKLRDRAGERTALGLRELHVDYADNIRNTRLKIPDRDNRTGRNINSVRKIAAMLSGEGG